MTSANGEESFQYEEASADPALHGYELPELDRGAEALLWDFGVLGKTPVDVLAEKLATEPHVSVIDGGCGTGNQLLSLITMAGVRASIRRIVGRAISDHNFLGFAQPTVQAAFAPGSKLSYEVIDLTSKALAAKSCDVAYSYEVVPHLERPEALILNLWQALRPKGELFFNALECQRAQINTATLEIIRNQGGLVSEAACPLTISQVVEQLLTGEQRYPRRAYRIIKPPDPIPHPFARMRRGALLGD